MTRATRQLLKRDTFGAIYLCTSTNDQCIERNIGEAPWWSRPLARWLMRREARALGRLHDVSGFTRLRSMNRNTLVREFVDGEPMYVAKPQHREYYVSALAQLRALHRRGIVHNDLAKEPNWLETPDGSAAIVDFQLASVFRVRTARFRRMAHEDLRHFLKHKRTYRPASLTHRERRILATRSPANRLWMATVKPVYLFVTRRIFHWSDREGAADRGKQ
ncbi:MAG: RIO1 family regulatory kinase/ATPase [Pseudomonadota bacterium]